MHGLAEVSETNHHVYFSWFFVIRLIVFAIVCDFGKAGIIVYDHGVDIEEFPDIELPFTQSIRRNGIEGLLILANPLHGCSNISKPPELNESINWFVLMSGNSCTFETKVLNARIAGYSLGIIYTYRARVETPSKLGHYRFFSPMPAVVVKTEHAIRMTEYYLYDKSMRYKFMVYPNNSFSIMTFLLLFSIVAGLFLVTMLAFTVIRFFQQSNTAPLGRLSTQHLRQLQTTVYKKGDQYETCAICLEDYKDKDKLRILPCSHGYHTKCIDPWLTNNRRICPVCKRKVILGGDPPSNVVAQSFNERTETTPLLQARRLDPRGTYNYLNAASAANPNHNSLPMSHRVSSSVHSLPDAVTADRLNDGQHAVSFLQL